MRSLWIAVALVTLSLIACNGSKTPAPETDAATPTLETVLENALIETSEYAGIIVSESGASEFGYLFNEPSTDFWEPSTDDVSEAEKCIKEYLVSAQDGPASGSYQKEDVAFILENLGEYRRQYVGILVDGEKRIWCNAFYSDTSYLDWERDPVDVDGGGRNYWQIEYVLPSDECINFNVHGES